MNVVAASTKFVQSEEQKRVALGRGLISISTTLRYVAAPATVCRSAEELLSGCETSCLKHGAAP